MTLTETVSELRRIIRECEEAMAQMPIEVETANIMRRDIETFKSALNFLWKDADQ